MYIKDFFLYKYIFSVNKDSMTDFSNQSNQNVPFKFYLLREVKEGRTSEMRSVIIYVLLTWFTYDLGISVELLEKGVDFRKEDEILDFNKSESSIRIDNALMTFLQEQPVAVLVELRQPLLEKIKEILDEENELDFPMKRTILATFDSKGLHDVSVHNDTFEWRKTIMGLQPTTSQREGSSPTIHVLGDLLQKDLPEGSILLVTMTKPSDEGFESNVMRPLIEKKNQVSVLWTGNYPSDEYLLLKNITESTGGKFRHITKGNRGEILVEHLLKSDAENLSEQIKFPEEQKVKEAPLLSKSENQRIPQKHIVPLIIEVASGTSLEVRSGTPTQIQFNVKNNLNVILPVIFNAKFNGVAQNVQPHQALLQPFGTITVIINLQPIGPAQSINAVGTLTLLAAAANKVTSRSALIFLTPQTTTDNTPPKMYHKYEGECSNYKEPQNCENGHWSLEATIQDEDSGLLKILSEPYGLLFQSEFVAGTKSPTTVHYTANCCQPNVIIWAEDLKGNYVKKSFDVFNQNLLAGEIASIVLGILLILFIVIAVIAAIVLIRRRNQRNMIIPRARSSSR